jgi:hypothetical protein
MSINYAKADGKTPCENVDEAVANDVEAGVKVPH